MGYTCRGKRIVLEECPYECSCIKIGYLIVVANYDVAWPYVSHTTDAIMNDCYMFTAARPFFPGDIGLMEKDGWAAAAAITLCPLPEPERNWSISFEEGTIIGDSAIACSMQFNERDRPYGVASPWYDGVRTGDGGESGDTPSKYTGQHNS